MSKTISIRTMLGTTFLLGLGVGMSARRRDRVRGFQGRTALVTGGSRGLGLELVRELSHRGARVLFCARTADEVHRAERLLHSEGHHRARGYVADISRPDGPADLWSQIQHETKCADLLVNNAGIIQVMPFVRAQEKSFHDCLDTFLYGPLRMTQEVLGAMISGGGGTVVNIASVGGQIPAPHLIPYNAGKAALVALSEGLSVELDRYGVNVLTVVPGLMRTGSHRNAQFAGDSSKEYAWFSRAALHPALTVPPDRAARQIVDAVSRGKRKLSIGWEAKLAPLFHVLTPELSHRVVSAIEKLLPGTGQDSVSRQGEIVSGDSPPLSALFQGIERQAIAQYQSARYAVAEEDSGPPSNQLCRGLRTRPALYTARL